MRHHQKRFLVFFIVISILLILGLIYFFINFNNPKNVISKLIAETAYAQELPEEYIQDFQVQITINQDNTVDVSEKIIYNFGDLERHSIYREIPYKYKAWGGNFTVGLNVKSVTTEAGQPYPYLASKGGGLVKIKIGDQNKLVTGVQTYIINYQMNRVINFFGDHDEFYWNVTGNNWAVPIDRTGIVIKLPAGTQAADVMAECFTGKLGGKEKNCQVTNVSNSQVGYSVFKILPAGEGLTVVLGWPKGILTPPSIITQIKLIINDNPLILLPLFSLLLMLSLWFLKGRDLGGKQSVIPLYQAPDDLSPAEVGSLIDERVNLSDISSTIIYLAVKGYIRIKESGKRDWEFIKLKEFDGLKIWENDFAKEIFGAKSAVKVSELKNKFYRHLPELKKSLYQHLVEKNFFPTSPSKVRLIYTLIAFILVFLGIIVSPFFGGGLNIVYLIISGIIILCLGQYMPYKTKEGTRMLWQIQGYKMYLSVAEKDRIKFHQAPAKSPQEFEKHLPYAMVLGVEKKWAKEFKDIYLNEPDWYEGQFTTFNSLIFISSLNNLNYSAKSVMVTRPNSGAAHGSSGFSGGGFSGGGFSGGGGGSW